MNWIAFFEFLGIAACVFGFSVVAVPGLMFLERKFGTYPALAVLFVGVSLVGATIAGLTH